MRDLGTNDALRSSGVWYENKKQLEMLLLGSFGVWLALNGLFFYYSNDRSFQEKKLHKTVSKMR